MTIGVMYDPEQQEKEELNSTEQQLVSWVMSRVNNWEDHRDNNYEARWNEYYRLWRGIYKSEDKTRDSERSTLISPATAQAIEVASAEIEEAIFGKGKWFDVSDDVRDLEKDDMELFRNALLEDLNEFGFPRAFSEVILNACIYGTGIGKLSVEEVEEYTFGIDDGGYSSPEFAAEANPKIKLTLLAIEPRSFAIDPTARTIDEALGCAHTLLVPKHSVSMKIQSGVYRNVTIGSYQNDYDFASKGEVRGGSEDEVQLTEYHGLVPARLLDVDNEDNDLDDLGIIVDQDEVLVEAIITIGNKTELLKAVENPYTMKDRSFVAYQHDTVPNRFWGRGIAEKGYNPQKALDAELRGRIDAMALAIHPMMAIDATRVPRGGDFSVRAGKTILTNGDPRTVLMPFNLGQVGTNTFQESGNLERMIQMATGSMDSASPISVNSRNSTASGMSMIQAGAVKRSKRTLANIESSFTKPLVMKCAWRMMQFNQDKYPPTDPKFIINSTLGIMAREIEMQQLSSLLSTTQGNTVGYWMLMRSIYEHSSVTNREQMMKIAEEMLNKAMNPAPDPMLQVKQSEIQLKQQYDQAKLQIEGSRAQTEAKRVQLEEIKTEGIMKKSDADTKLLETKAEATRRTTIVETEEAIKHQENKNKELDIKEAELTLKKRDQDLKIELEKNKILLEKDQLKLEERKLKAEIAKNKSDANESKNSKDSKPEIHINGSSKKKITVKRTKDGGLEGISEEI